MAGSESDCSDCPGLELTDDECDDDDDGMPGDNDDDTFDPDAVPVSCADFDIGDQPELLDYIKRHVDFCCRSLSFAIAKLTADRTCRVLAIDILPSKEVEDSCPEELRSRLIYWKLDLIDFTYRGFQNLVRDKLGCKITQQNFVKQLTETWESCYMLVDDRVDRLVGVTHIDRCVQREPPQR